MAYKLVRYGGRLVLKLSSGKATIPDAKQIFLFTKAGQMHHDVVAFNEEDIPGGEPLLRHVMAGGKITSPLPEVSEIRGRFLEEFIRLDDGCKAIYGPTVYPVEISPGLQSISDETKSEVVATVMEHVHQEHEPGES